MRRELSWELGQRFERRQELLRQTWNHGGLELFGLLVEIDQLSDDGELASLLTRLLDVYGLRSVAYLGADVAAGPRGTPYIAVTYSPQWVECYRAARYFDVDPAIQVGLRRMLPIDWAEFERTDKKVRRLFGEAGEFGLGRQGMSLPVHGRHGDRALVSITSDADDKDWNHHRHHYMRDFQLMALHLHQAVLRLAGGDDIQVAALSPRERECLQWIAEGKTCWEIVSHGVV